MSTSISTEKWVKAEFQKHIFRILHNFTSNNKNNLKCLTYDNTL